MKTKTRCSKHASIAKTRWAAYAAAGAATALAGSHSAEAAIHYSGPLNVQQGLFHCSNSDTWAEASSWISGVIRCRLDAMTDVFFNARGFLAINGLASAAFRGPDEWPYF